MLNVLTRRESDPLTGTLPVNALLKRRAIGEERDTAAAIVRGLVEDYTDALSARRALESERAGMQANRRGVNVDMRDTVAYRACEAGILTAQERLARLEERRAAATARQHALSSLCSNLDTWLSEASAVVLIEASSSPEPKLRKGETAADGLERCRRRVRELNADRHTVMSAPIPSAEAKEAARGYVKALIEIGRPDVFGLIERGGRIEWPEREVQHIPGAGAGRAGFTFPTVPSTVATMAWLQPEAFLAALVRDIDAAADDGAALTDADRSARLAEIAADKLAVEREEEWFFTELQKTGGNQTRRPDADPRAVLGLADDMPLPQID